MFSRMRVLIVSARAFSNGTISSLSLFDPVDSAQQVGDQDRAFLNTELFHVVDRLFDAPFQRLGFRFRNGLLVVLDHFGQPQDGGYDGGIQRASVPVDPVFGGDFADLPEISRKGLPVDVDRDAVTGYFVET